MFVAIMVMAWISCACRCSSCVVIVHGVMSTSIPTNNHSLLLLGIYACLARTEHALLEHVARSHDLTKRVGLRAFRCRHLEHGFVDMRVELLAHLAELAIRKTVRTNLLDSLRSQRLFQLLLRHHHSLVQCDQRLLINSKHHSHLIGALSLNAFLGNAADSQAEVIAHTQETLSKALDCILTFTKCDSECTQHTSTRLSSQSSAHSAFQRGDGCFCPSDLSATHQKRLRTPPPYCLHRAAI